MKNNLMKSAVLASSLLFANFSFADGTPQPSDQMNHWAIGVGSYAFVITNDNEDNYYYGDYDNGDYDFSGFNVNASYAFNNHFQIRGTYFSLEDNDVNSRKSKGYDIMAYGGVGFAKSGFRGYGGAGYYSDKWSYEGDYYSARYYSDESFSGFQFGGGLGYNWGPVALDFVITLREADAYESEFTRTGTYIAMSGNLSVSYLF